MGPILPFITVYGKQIGVSPMVMGTVTSILPILFLLSKPAFGFLVDHFREKRKFIFVGLLIATSLAFVSMYFLPIIPGLPIIEHGIISNVTTKCNQLVTCEDRNITKPDECYGEKSLAACRWFCDDGKNSSATVIFQNRSEINFSLDSFCTLDYHGNLTNCDDKRIVRICNFSCELIVEDKCLYESLTFWGFVMLVSLGCIGFNVSNSISDAICFDVLGQ